MNRAAWRSYRLLLRWQLLRQARLLPLLVGIQIALGLGLIYGFGFLVPQITPQIALYLATGAVTLSVILIGLSVVSQETAQARTSGRHLYVTSLPVPRLAPMFAEVTFWVLVQLPGSAATLLLAKLRFHLVLHISLLVIPAIMLVCLTAASIGYAVAVSLPPTATQQVSQFLSIGLLLFSPISFPISRLPHVLQDIHRVLPITYMADIVRGSLTGRFDVGRPLAFGVVGLWCAVGLLASGWVASRRR